MDDGRISFADLHYRTRCNGSECCSAVEPLWSGASGGQYIPLLTAPVDARYSRRRGTGLLPPAEIHALVLPLSRDACFDAAAPLGPKEAAEMLNAGSLAVQLHWECSGGGNNRAPSHRGTVPLHQAKRDQPLFTAVWPKDMACPRAEETLSVRVEVLEAGQLVGTGETRPVRLRAAEPERDASAGSLLPEIALAQPIHVAMFLLLHLMGSSGLPGSNGALRGGDGGMLTDKPAGPSPTDLFPQLHGGCWAAAMSRCCACTASRAAWRPWSSTRTGRQSPSMRFGRGSPLSSSLAWSVSQKSGIRTLVGSGSPLYRSSAPAGPAPAAGPPIPVRKEDLSGPRAPSYSRPQLAADGLLGAAAHVPHLPGRWTPS